MTSSNEVFFPKGEDYSTWKSDVNKYTYQKRDFVGKPQPTNFVTQKEIKMNESLYNPITQKYNDNSSEVVARKNEQDNFIHTLAKNKDNALRYEQTYNVINFENKLAGLE